jgi:hypothetical protein
MIEASDEGCNITVNAHPLQFGRSPLDRDWDPVADRFLPSKFPRRGVMEIDPQPASTLAGLALSVAEFPGLVVPHIAPSPLSVGGVNDKTPAPDPVVPSRTSAGVLA